MGAPWFHALPGPRSPEGSVLIVRLVRLIRTGTRRTIRSPRALCSRRSRSRHQNRLRRPAARLRCADMVAKYEEREPATMNLVQLDDIRRASETISGVAVRTPLLPCPWALGTCGSSRRICSRSARSKSAARTTRWRASTPPIARVAWSPTRPAITAGRSRTRQRAFGVPAVVVMPDVAPPGKIASVAALGAEIVLVPPARAARRG